ncbi:hypothetical protein HNQ80_000150 [Anaerosolibacter carboniphilus]|uniref:DUF4870 domain-containing protein n=2 Tax=Anaerosolibacter carboniphilus TaxID=1417629 RepID=A0A841KLG9_9FIRM|nr:hypothetical protein [Anaerosolibacter carboniphilus]
MMMTTEQKLLCAIAHLGWVVALPILAPLVILILTNDTFVKNQAKEALIFQIGVGILTVVFGILSILLIGIPLLLILLVGALIFPIIAVVKSCDGVDYSYPVTGSVARKF